MFVLVTLGGDRPTVMSPPPPGKRVMPFPRPFARAVVPELVCTLESLGELPKILMPGATPGIPI